jgi:bacterioferritin-associated ferredoxin
VIVCSCNVLSDSQIRSAIASGTPCARLKQVYTSLCCAAKCGRCARTIKAILEAHKQAPMKVGSPEAADAAASISSS